MKRDLLYEKNTGKIIFVSTHRDQNITGRNMSQKNLYGVFKYRKPIILIIIILVLEMK